MDGYFKSKRTLKCITDGKVISLAELRSEQPQLNKGSGFAVLPPLLTGTLLERFLPDTVQISAPADGVIISTESGITLRTGDGISITVATGTQAELLCSVGARVRGGEALCTLPREQLMKNGMDGAAAVIFPDTSAITELHVISGRRKAGARTAFYHILPHKQR